MGKGGCTYFETKGHVLRAMREEYVSAFSDTTEAILTRGEAWWPTPDVLLTQPIHHAVNHAEPHRLVRRSANATALYLRKESNARVVECICEFVVRGEHVGALRSRNAG
ncbi:hypothetical protein ACWCXB_34700 [Streptomyces sp. NPDC001514]